MPERFSLTQENSDQSANARERAIGIIEAESKFREVVVSHRDKKNPPLVPGKLERLIRASVLVWAMGMTTKLAAQTIENHGQTKVVRSLGTDNHTLESSGITTVSEMEPGAIEKLRKLAQEADDAVVVVPAGENNPQILIDLCSMAEDEQFSPIVFNGQYIRIEIGKTFADKDMPLLMSKAAERARDKGGLFVQTIRDKDLNEVNFMFKTIDDSYTEVVSSFTPAPAIPRQPDQKLVPISLNLGHGSIELTSGLMYQVAAVPINEQRGETDRPIYVGNNLLTEVEKQKALERISQANKGFVEVEREFGFQPGELIKSVWIDAKNERNAYDFSAKPEVIMMTKGFLLNPDTTPEQAYLVGRHEAFHAIDHFYRLNETRGNGDNLFEPAFGKAFFETLKDADFQKSLEEHTFFPGAFGGHVKDGGPEVFASFMNSLSLDSVNDWKEKISTKDAQYLLAYKALLQGALDGFSETEIKKDAPIFAAVKERLEFIDSKLAHY